MKKVTITFLADNNIREKDVNILMDIGLDNTMLNVTDYNIKIENLSNNSK